MNDPDFESGSPAARIPVARIRDRLDALTGKKVHQDPDEEKMNSFRKSVPMSARLRPQWDMTALLNLGFRRIECDADITELVWDDEEKIKYRSRPMFMICVDKRPGE